jgi:hypothetical protein
MKTFRTRLFCMPYRNTPVCLSNRLPDAVRKALLSPQSHYTFYKIETQPERKAAENKKQRMLFSTAVKKEKKD